MRLSRTRTSLVDWDGRATPTSYRAVAREYLQLCAQGARDPTNQIAEREGYNRSTVAGWVSSSSPTGLPASEPKRKGGLEPSAPPLNGYPTVVDCQRTARRGRWYAVDACARHKRPVQGRPDARCRKSLRTLEPLPYLRPCEYRRSAQAV